MLHLRDSFDSTEQRRFDMIRAMLPGVLAFTLLTGSASIIDAGEFYSGNENSSGTDCESYNGCQSEEGFIYRLFNFRPWNDQSRYMQSSGVPGLPRGRRYFGGRYFGQFNNRYYGPQYGNF